MRRFPHGKRGLKYVRPAQAVPARVSLPPREAWIEIFLARVARLDSLRRFPHGKRGLKYFDILIHVRF